MLNSIFTGLFDTTTTESLDTCAFIACIIAGLVLGLIIALSYMYKTRTSKSFAATLALLPALVCVVIMMVNGNVGAGVAVAGAFSLVRFRSAPGSAKEIAAVFLAMASGLICGMGYIAYAVLFTVIMCLAMILLTASGFGEKEGEGKELRITIPEDLDYEGVFDSIFEKYTEDCKLLSVKTSDMGSLFRLTYKVSFKNEISEKEFIDKLRVKNGNLPIVITQMETGDTPAL